MIVDAIAKLYLDDGRYWKLNITHGPTSHVGFVYVTSMDSIRGTVEIRNSETNGEALFEVVMHLQNHMKGGTIVRPMGPVFAHNGPFITMAHMEKGVACRIEVPDNESDIPGALHSMQQQCAKKMHEDGKFAAAGRILPFLHKQALREEPATIVQ